MARVEAVWRVTMFVPPDRIEAANVLRRALADVGRRLRSLRADHGISPAKLSLLGRLVRAGRPMTATELASLERLQPQSLTRVIAGLEADGLIARKPNGTDRRQIDISLTERGRTLIRRDAVAQNAWLAEAIDQRLSPTEQAVLMLAADLLDRLTDHDGAAIGIPTDRERADSRA